MAGEKPECCRSRACQAIMPGTSSLSCAQGGLCHAKLQGILAGFDFGCLSLLAVLGGAGVLLTCTGLKRYHSNSCLIGCPAREENIPLAIFYLPPPATRKHGELSCLQHSSSPRAFLGLATSRVTVLPQCKPLASPTLWLLCLINK